MKNLTPPRPEPTYTLEVTESELKKLIAFSYSFECKRNLGENYSSPYIPWEILFPDLAEEVHTAQDKITDWLMPNEE